MLIEELNFSVRTYNALKRAGVHTVEEISGRSNGDLLKLRGIGRNAIREIRDKVPRKACKVAPVVCSGDHMALWKAMGLLVKEYEKAQTLDYVRKPLAWALFQVWKMADKGNFEMRDISLKPRETGNLPPEKLLSILRKIYPEDVAQQLFEQINEHVEQEDAE